MAITKEEREQFRIEYERKRAAEKLIVDTLLAEGDFLDDDGYPTDAAHTIVELWPWEDKQGWFTFIESIWHLKSWGWHEGTTPHDWDKERQVYQYNISTAGWSGNEGLIHAMEKNTWLWTTTWVQSRRGGHYIFEVELDD
jgi:hypothetical protein